MSKDCKCNTIRGPVNSWILNYLSNYLDRLFGKAKIRLFKNHPDCVVEIGPGAGANMRYYRRGTTVIAIEPNIHIHSNLRKSAVRYGIDLDIRSLMGESIDLPDSSCDFVVCTLVLCTVDDPEACLSQIKRILKPNGVVTTAFE